MADKIRLGFVGANVNSTWSSQSHYPALLASPDVELTAVCTSRPESAEDARQAFGAKLAFHDFREMASSPEIEAVAVVVRVPLHYEPTKASIEAGKHVYTEWPLGRSTAEAEELAALANAKGVQTAVGLQSRVSPALLYIKELIDGKRMLFCEDSIVRGTQLRDTIQRLYDAGAQEVHMRPACPPLIYGCKFLNFSRSRSELDLAGRRAICELEGADGKNIEQYADPCGDKHCAMVDRIARRLNLTSLKYQKLDDLVEAVGLPKEQLCTFCWDGAE